MNPSLAIGAALLAAATPLFLGGENEPAPPNVTLAVQAATPAVAGPVVGGWIAYEGTAHALAPLVAAQSQGGSAAGRSSDALDDLSRELERLEVQIESQLESLEVTEEETESAAELEEVDPWDVDFDEIFESVDLEDFGDFSIEGFDELETFSLDTLEEIDTLVLDALQREEVELGEASERCAEQECGERGATRQVVVGPGTVRVITRTCCTPSRASGLLSRAHVDPSTREALARATEELARADWRVRVDTDAYRELAEEARRAAENGRLLAVELATRGRPQADERQAELEGRVQELERRLEELLQGEDRTPEPDRSTRKRNARVEKEIADARGKLRDLHVLRSTPDGSSFFYRVPEGEAPSPAPRLHLFRGRGEATEAPAPPAPPTPPAARVRWRAEGHGVDARSLDQVLELLDEMRSDLRDVHDALREIRSELREMSSGGGTAR